MGCFTPLQAYQSLTMKSNGKKSIAFSPNGNDLPIKLPCGQCIGCRLSRSSDWASRCMHESTLHQENSFITLTYNEENLPYDESLTKPHFQKFMKRLRKSQPNKKLRYYMCGEYGEKYKRPHYHLILFGYKPTDLEPYGINHKGEPLYTSPSIVKLWGKGYVDVGSVTYESAAYVARYIMKKQTGQKAHEHYEHVTRYGELINLEPEYTDMSRRPGIAHDWFLKNRDELYSTDSIVVKRNNKYIEQKIPRYYDSLESEINPENMEHIKENRFFKGYFSEHNDPARLAAKQKITEQKLTKLKRTL